MTIKTLTFIHELLIEEEAKTARIEKWCRESLYAAENEGKPTEELKKEKDMASKFHSEALAALQDFENHEWR